MQKTTSTLKSLTFFLFIGLTILTGSASAQVQQTFTPRFSEAVNGDFTMIANNVLSQHATQNYNGSDDNHYISSVFVDIDSDPTTFNSSNAIFSNPSPSSPCITFKGAYLYWAAANKEHDLSGVPHTGNGEPEVNWPSNQVKLMLPGSVSYMTVTADETIYDGRAEHFVNDPQVHIKDITALVQGLSNPYGRFQVANVKATVGALASHRVVGLGGNIVGTSGGWQVVFIYESPQLKRRNITIFDGYANITSTENSFDILFDGFQTVPNGPVNANMLIGSIEGDRGILGDQLQILDTDGYMNSLVTDQRNADNFFNSKITLDGNQFLDRSPASTNTLGFDAALFELYNLNNYLIDNDQTSAVIRMTSDQETYGLYLLGLSVEVFEPSLGALNFTTDVIGSTFDPGDTAPVEIRIKNVGNDDIRNLEIALTLPPQVEFMDTALLPPGVTYTLDTGARELRFFVEDGYTDINDPEYVLDFNLFINDTCPTCSAEIALQAMATFTGETNPATVATLSSGTVDECGVGNHDPTYLYVIPVLSLVDAEAMEGSDLPFSISSSHLLSEDVTLDLTYTNITASDSDYAPISTYTVPEGTGTTVLNISTIEDLMIELSENFELTIASTDQITILDNTAIGTIIDNDMSADAGIDFDMTDITVDESAGTATFTVRLTGHIPGGFTLDYTTTDGSAVSPGDYTTVSGQLTFLGNDDESYDITVPIIDDALIEPTEAYTVELSNLSTALIAINTPTANGTIIDNDGSNGTGIDFDSTDVTVDEAAGTATFTVRLTGDVPGGFTVDYTTIDGTAISPDDYTAVLGQLTFLGNNNESHDITVPIIDDNLIEPTEEYSVELSNLSTTIIAINTPTANGNIIDNDMRMITSNEYTEEYTITCGDTIPEVPELTFSGGCGDYQVDFNEVEDASETSDDFMIVRTWDVTDSCGNTATFEQIIFVMQLEEAIITLDICINEDPIDLASYLPENFDTDGTFTVTQGTAILNGSLFDPTDLELGEFVISYSSSEGRCTYSALFTINVNADCADCSEEDITVSTAVTPNGDSFNDVFAITGTEECFFTYDVMIFNRWGKKVYEAQDYQNTWAGTSPDSSFGTSGNLPTGTYYYIINVSNRLDLKPINGYIYLGTK